MIALGTDYLATASITNSSAIQTQNGHPIEYVQDQRLSRSAWILPDGFSGNLYGSTLYGQTPYLNLSATAEVVIDFDIGSIVEASLFGLAGNNWDSVHIEISWSETDIESPDGSITYDNDNPEYVVMVPLGDQNIRYLRVRIFDVSPDGNYLVIGRMGLGALFQFPDYAPSVDVDLISTATRAFSETRQLYGSPKVVYRRINVSYPQVEEPLKLSNYFRELDLYNPIFLGLDEECLAYAQNMYVTFSEDTIPYSRTETGLFTARLSFEEVF